MAKSAQHGLSCVKRSSRNQFGWCIFFGGFAFNLLFARDVIFKRMSHDSLMHKTKLCNCTGQIFLIRCFPYS